MSNKDKFVYEIVKKDEKDFTMSTIVKKGVEVEFRLHDVQRHAEQLRKQLDEATAEMNLRNAEVTNIEENHPFVKDFTPEQLHALNLYIASKGDSEKLTPIVAQIQAALDGYATEQEDIYKQLGLEEPSIVEDVEATPVKGMTTEQVKQEKQSDEGNPV
jgi:hypothetical protein